MTQEASELLKKALTLSAEERAQLVDSLLESLDEPREDPAVVEAAWNDEIRRRIEDLDAGKAKTVPWEEVRRLRTARADFFFAVFPTPWSIVITPRLSRSSLSPTPTAIPASGRPASNPGHSPRHLSTAQTLPRSPPRSHSPSPVACSPALRSSS